MIIQDKEIKEILKYKKKIIYAGELTKKSKVEDNLII